ELDNDPFRPGSIDVLAQHVMAIACAGPFSADDLLVEVNRAAPYSTLTQVQFERVLDYIANGGYALKAYEKYRRLTRTTEGLWRVSHPQFAAQHRLNAGIIVEAPMLDVRFRNGRRLGKVEEAFAAALSPGDTFFFAGMSLEVERVDTSDVLVRA